MDSPEDRPTDHGRPRWSFYRLLPLGFLGAGLVLFFASGLDDYVTFEALREHRASLIAWVDDAGMRAILLFGVVYAAGVAFSVPVGAVLTITAGFLFGPVTGTIVAVCAATVGATALFVAARTGLGEHLRASAGPALVRMARGFERDAFSYLLTLRLIPLFPFWLVNLVPALTRMRLGSFVLATAIGIVPGTLVFALVGNGVGAVFQAGGTPDVGIIFQPSILAPIIGLALLSLLPVAYRRLRRRKEDREPESCCGAEMPVNDQPKRGTRA